MGTRVLSEEEAEAWFRQYDRKSLLEERLGKPTLVEHEAISFPSYPYEWPPEMLHAAGELTLDLAQDLLADGLGLKDATPYNVLFRGPEPVFVDVLSIDRRDPLSPIWLPRAEFIRTILLPLLASTRFGRHPNRSLTWSRDGLEPEELFAWITPILRLLPPYLSLVSIPTWLGRRHSSKEDLYRKRSVPAEKARFIVEYSLRSLRKQLKSLAPPSGRKSTWSGYAASTPSYSQEQSSQKEQFVRDFLREYAPKRVLDIGSNTGHFSVLAAESGASVVAIDSDPVVVGQTWRVARAKGLPILPLVVDLARPTPAMGWRYQEYLSFLSRANGSFDAVLMLAVLHHLLATARVPLPDILSLVAGFTKAQRAPSAPPTRPETGESSLRTAAPFCAGSSEARTGPARPTNPPETRAFYAAPGSVVRASSSNGVALLEFVSPDDTMFRLISRGREDLYSYLTLEYFEQACNREFEIVRSLRIVNSNRWLYVVKGRS